MANAEIVAIGSELLLGQIVDTNSAWMAQRLTALGVNLYFTSVVGDNPGRMREVIARALARADIVITSGGIGPTQDDLTREIVAEVTGRKLVQDAAMLTQVEEHFRRRGRPMTPNNIRQSYMPEGAIPIKNPNGTAPSFIVEDPRAVIYSLPGVPVEMKWLFENEVEPYLREKSDRRGAGITRASRCSDCRQGRQSRRSDEVDCSRGSRSAGITGRRYFCRRR